jgi:hypothetical protein
MESNTAFKSAEPETVLTENITDLRKFPRILLKYFVLFHNLRLETTEFFFDDLLLRQPFVLCPVLDTVDLHIAAEWRLFDWLNFSLFAGFFSLPISHTFPYIFFFFHLCFVSLIIPLLILF